MWVKTPTSSPHFIITMKIIQRPRQSGKTTEVVERTKLNKKAVMIVMSEMEKQRIKKLCPKISTRVITFQEYTEGHFFRGRDFKEAYIDQGDYCLNRFSRTPITLMTLDD